MPFKTRVLRNQWALFKEHDWWDLFASCILTPGNTSLLSASPSSSCLIDGGGPQTGRLLNGSRESLVILPGTHSAMNFSSQGSFKHGLGGHGTCGYFSKATGGLNFSRPSSSLGRLPLNTQHAASLYEKLEFGQWEGWKENGGGRESLRIPQGPGGERRTGGIPEESPPPPSGSCFSTPFSHIFAHSLLPRCALPETFVAS